MSVSPEYAATHRPALRARRLAHLALAAAALFWAGNFVAGRALGGAVDPVLLNTLRWAVCLALFAPVAAPRLLRHRRVLLRDWRLVVLLGATGLAAFHSMTYLALADTTAINALLTLALTPAVILLAVAVAGRRRPTAWQALGSALSFAGVAVLVTEGRMDRLLALRPGPGDAWMLGAVLVWAAYSLLLRRRPADLPADVALAGSIVVALALLIPAALVTGGVPALGALGPGDWAIVLYIAVCASLVAFLCWSHGVAVLGAATAGQYIHLMPVFGAALAVALLGERVIAAQAVGAALVLGGIVLVSRGGRAP